MNSEELYQKLSQLEESLIYEQLEQNKTDIKIEKSVIVCRFDQKEKSRFKPGQKFKLDRDLSKNLFLVILSYLKCNEIHALFMTNKIINKKISNEFYFHKLRFDAYQKFFLQQFNTSSSKQWAFSFQTRESESSNDYSFQQLSQKDKQSRCSRASHDSNEKIKEQIQEEVKNIREFNEKNLCINVPNQDYNYENIKFEEMKESCDQLHQQYRKLICNKKFLISQYKRYFKDRYSMDCENFARELLLDPSDSNFQSPNAESSKEQITDADSILKQSLTSKNKIKILQQLMSDLCDLKQQCLNFEKIIQEQDPLQQKFSMMYYYLSNLKLLMKKISMNLVIKDTFTKYLLNQGILTEQSLSCHCYLGDFLLLNILDQIWIQYVYQPNLEDLVEILKREVEMCHHIERLDDLLYKRNILLKMLEEVKLMESNQQNNLIYAQIVNPNYQICEQSQFNYLNEHFKDVIKIFLIHLCKTSNSLGEFQSYTKKYECSKFISPNYERYYFFLKLQIIKLSFSKELEQKLLEMNNIQTFQATKEMSLNQLLPHTLHGTYFYKMVQQILRSADIQNIHSLSSIKQCLFLALFIDGNITWAERLNKSLRKCQEKLMKYNKDEQQFQESNSDILEGNSSEFQKLIVQIALIIDTTHNFEEEINIRKEQKKQKIQRDIYSRLQLLTIQQFDPMIQVNRNVSLSAINRRDLIQQQLVLENINITEGH
ncbi:UNKNOWN [Stylonychia lemnae]|uniref:Uncharacterized protein n=1 Tax=Stylonychia lemnae TaxID=5949 RepID=A0A078AXV6_STYLE|nr:UNKNOWN [Stylonychia lemnae]|eukprot:CDW85628.1 UNKNOWN [Stylonychia lemnae]